MERLLKKLNKVYFNKEVSKYTLPEEIAKNIIKVPIQDLINISEKIFFDFGKENIFDLDNSINSLIGC
tara:strand:- start:342 stop:545 length:204 start_codon:yes stop_codon:yes gene_type:complete